MSIPKDYNPIVRTYASGMRYCVEHKGYYINADGVPETNNASRVKYQYNTRGEAQKALDKYNNNKGNVTMCMEDLKTGMQVVFNGGRTAIVMLGHDYGDIVIFEGRTHLNISSLDFNPDSTSVYRVESVHKPVNQMGIVNTEAERCIVPVWENKVEIVVMTIAELQEQLGIKNLQIKD